MKESIINSRQLIELMINLSILHFEYFLVKIILNEKKLWVLYKCHTVTQTVNNEPLQSVCFISVIFKIKNLQ